MFTLLHIQT